MTLAALGGLIGLNLGYLLTGLILLWALRGYETLSIALRLAGLAYLLGVALNGTLWTLLTIFGVPFTPLVLLFSTVLICLLSLITGLRLHRPVSLSLRFPPVRVGLLVHATGISLTGVFFEALFRTARLHGLYAWDAWAFWIPKAKALYYYHGLDVGFFTSLPGPSYPPLLPVLDAASFFAMGSPDVITLHVQFWFFSVGFTWAISGLLVERVPSVLLWPFILLMVIAPRLGERFIVPEADLLLQFFFASSVLCLYFWLQDNRQWHLASAAILLSATVLTKREGLILVALLAASTLLAWRHSLHRRWRPLVLTTLTVGCVAGAWRIWYVLHNIPGEGSGLGIGGKLERIIPSLRLAFTVLLNNNYWSVLIGVMLGALLIGALARHYTPVIFFGSLVLLITLGGAWITWSLRDLPITEALGANPIVRYMGASALVAVVSTPLLLAHARGSAGRMERDRGTWLSFRTDRTSARVGVTILASIPLLVYPATSLAGGWPPFPGSEGCSIAPAPGMPVNVVFGRLDTPVEARQLMRQVVKYGFRGVGVESDDCGRWIVVLPRVPSDTVGREVIEEAHTVGLAPWLEGVLGS